MVSSNCTCNQCQSGCNHFGPIKITEPTACRYQLTPEQKAQLEEAIKKYTEAEVRQ